jgi:hypothetical protein
MQITRFKLMHNLPLFGLIFVFLVSVLWLASKGVRSFLGDFFSVLDDRWTWTTLSGDLYEDAEIEAIEDDLLVLRHRFGMAHVPLEELSDASRQLLLRTPQWRHHIGTSTQGGATPFIEEPVHAAQPA